MAASSKPRRSERLRLKASQSAPPCSHTASQSRPLEAASLTCIRCSKSPTPPEAGGVTRHRPPAETSTTGRGNKDNSTISTIVVTKVAKRVVRRKRTKQSSTSVRQGASKEELGDKKSSKKNRKSARSTPEKKRDTRSRSRSPSTGRRGSQNGSKSRSRSSSNGRRRGSSCDKTGRPRLSPRSAKSSTSGNRRRCKSPAKSVKQLANLHIVEYLQDRIRTIPVPNRPVPITMSIKVLARELKLRLASTCLPFRETGRRGGKVKVTVVPQRDRVVPFYAMTLDQDPVHVGEEKILVPKWTKLVRKGG